MGNVGSYNQELTVMISSWNLMSHAQYVVPPTFVYVLCYEEIFM